MSNKDKKVESTSTWNYRIGTYMYSYKAHFPDSPKFQEKEDERLFCVISAYYKNGSKIPNSYGQSDYLDGLESMEDFKFTLDKIQIAYTKPIINLDSFPDEFDIK